MLAGLTEPAVDPGPVLEVEAERHAIGMADGGPDHLTVPLLEGLVEGDLHPVELIGG